MRGFAQPAFEVRRRGLWAFGSLAGGIVAARALNDAGAVVPGGVWFAVAFALAIAVALARGSGARIAALAAITALGAGVMTTGAYEARPHDLCWTLDEQPRLVELEGVIEQPPRQMQLQRGALAHVAAYNPTITRFGLHVRLIADDRNRWQPASGTLFVRVDEPVDAGVLQRGDVIRVIGFAQALRAPSNPGEVDRRTALHQRGVVGSLRVARASLVEPVAGAPSLWQRLLRWRDIARSRAIALIEQRSDSPHGAAVLGAILLGERDPVDDFAVESAFRRVGVAHVLAISGLHVGMVVGMVVLALRLVGDHPRVQWALVLLVIFAMVLFIPARAPILRAALIVASVVAADMAGRRYDRLNMLALVAGALLLFRPTDLFDPGYQLSFGVVAGLVGLGPRLMDRWSPNGAVGFGAPRLLVQSLIASSIAWSIATPIVLYHFGLVSPMAVISSVIAAPLVAVALAVGYVGLALALAVPMLGLPVLGAALAGSEALSGFVMMMDELPGIALRAPETSALAMGVVLVLVVLWWRTLSRATVPALDERLGVRRAMPWVLTACSVLTGAWIGLSWRHATRLGEDVALRIDMLDVGDGSAHLLRAGQDAVLFDCGSSWYGIGQRTIPDALRSLGAPRVRRLIISHADIDHFSGVIDAARLIGLREVIVSPQFMRAGTRAASPEAALLAALEDLDVEVHTVTAGDRIWLGSLDIEVMHPMAGDTFERGDNGASIVLRLTVLTHDGKRRVMFFGDLDGAGLTAFRSRVDVGQLVPDIIEAPHHGSAGPGLIDFVKALGPPALILQSTGPTRVDDERWQAVRGAAAWYCTATDGAVSVELLRSGAWRVERHGETAVDAGAQRP